MAHNNTLLNVFQSSGLLVPKALMTISALGFETVHQSLAQLSGGYITPVSFSFGWSGYSVKFLLAAFGKGHLLPDPDLSCTAVNLSNGITRQNKSWVLGRILRDYDSWKPKKVDNMVKEVIDEAYYNDKEREAKVAAKEQREQNPVYHRKQAGLVISVFHRATNKIEGKPGVGLGYYSGLLVTLIQLGIASSLCIYFKDSSSFAILAVTATGTLLAYLTGALPHWATEKWACRRLPAGKNKNIALTPGNGAQHVIIVAGETGALDLEDLANGNADVPITWLTRTWAVILALAWAGLSLFITSISDERAWFLLLIGVLGSLQNLFAARAPRKPEDLGLCLEMEYKLIVMGKYKVMAALKGLERRYAQFGINLYKVFFPQGVSLEEEKWWQERKDDILKREKETIERRNEEERGTRRRTGQDTEEV